MAIFAQVAQVQDRVPYRGAFTASTSPSSTAVQAWLDEAEAMYVNTLLAAGLGSFQPGTNGGKFITKWVLDYAEGRVRKAYAAAGGDGTNVDGQSLIDAFEERIEKIIDKPEPFGAVLTAGHAPDASIRLKSHVLDNADGQSISNGDFAPVFKKDAAPSGNLGNLGDGNF